MTDKKTNLNSFATGLAGAIIGAAAGAAAVALSDEKNRKKAEKILNWCATHSQSLDIFESYQYSP